MSLHASTCVQRSLLEHFCMRLPPFDCSPFIQHAAQPRPGRTDAAQGGDGDTAEGQRSAGPRAQSPQTELRGAPAATRSRPEGVVRPPTAAAAGTVNSNARL